MRRIGGINWGRTGVAMTTALRVCSSHWRLTAHGWYRVSSCWHVTLIELLPHPLAHRSAYSLGQSLTARAWLIRPHTLRRTERRERRWERECVVGRVMVCRAAGGEGSRAKVLGEGVLPYSEEIQGKEWKRVLEEEEERESDCKTKRTLIRATTSGKVQVCVRRNYPFKPLKLRRAAKLRLRTLFKSRAEIPNVPEIPDVSC